METVGRLSTPRLIGNLESQGFFIRGAWCEERRISWGVIYSAFQASSRRVIWRVCMGIGLNSDLYIAFQCFGNHDCTLGAQLSIFSWASLPPSSYNPYPMRL